VIKIQQSVYHAKDAVYNQASQVMTW